jgi:hypothetical protein
VSERALSPASAPFPRKRRTLVAVFASMLDPSVTVIVDPEVTTAPPP